MLPVAALPLSGLLLGIGYFIDPSGWGANNLLAAFMVKGGAAILDNLGILFAIGVGFGMTDNDDGAGALAALVSMLMLNTLLSTGSAQMFSNILGRELSAVDLAAFGKVGNGNAFLGILAGLIGSTCYNKFSDVRLHDAFAFFSGKRCVAIITGFVTMVTSAILFFIWPMVFGGLVGFGEGIASLGAFGAGIYGFFNRLLIPTGLHHALNAVFWFDIAGINDLGNFWSPNAPAGDWGLYMSGFFPIMMFGIPGAALAIYQTAKPENRKAVGSLMGAAAICSFITGVTEPIEFAFMFAAPMLFVVHALLTGISLTVVGMLGIRAGFNFSAGSIDLLLSSATPHAVNPWMLLPIGLAFGVLYYVVFRFVIVKFDLKTPGREDDEIEVKVVALADNDFTRVAEIVLEGLGGAGNLVTIDNCAVRLRLEINDQDLVDEKKIKSAGITGVMRPGKNTIQVIIGSQVQAVAAELKKLHSLNK